MNQAYSDLLLSNRSKADKRKKKKKTNGTVQIESFQYSTFGQWLLFSDIDTVFTTRKVESRK